MRQVFFSNAAVEAAGGDDASRFSDLSNNVLGLWDPYAQAGGDWFADALFDNRFITADTDTDDGDGSDIAVTAASITKRVLPLKQAFQVAQGFPSGNPLATPIISADKLVSVRCQAYEATTRHAVRISPADGGNSGDEMQLKFVIKQHPTSYLGYVNGEASIFDLSGGNYDFPLSGFHANNHKLITIGYTAGASDDASIDAIKAAVEGNSVLNAMMSVTDNGSTVDLDARHPGTIFEVIQHNATDDASAQSEVSVDATYDPGIGNPWQARADELKARAQAGNHNRMYFPQTFEDYVKGTGTDYQFDRFEITYKIDGDRDVVKGSQFGTVVIYEKDGTDALKTVLNMGTALTVTGTEYLF